MSRHSRIRLTMAQALARYLAAQRIAMPGGPQPLFHGVFAIFGHGNVAGLGEALQTMRDRLPVFRAHNEQAMAHAAIAFAKATRRRRMMACTTSIGPGATNLVTAAALAHVNRLPVLLLPGDVFASRVPDPVLQQVEGFGDPTVTANDCLRPVSRYFDRIMRPEQLLHSLPAAMAVLTDPADCGPVTLALPQDVQAEAADFPREFFDEHVHVVERAGADRERVAELARRLAAARRPLVIGGGGVHYSLACTALAQWAQRHGIPVVETQAGKGALAWDHPCNAGAVGVTGAQSANELLSAADLILAIGTRLQDFTTASGTLIPASDPRLASINVCRHDAIKRGGLAVRGDALRTLEELASAGGEYAVDAEWRERVRRLRAAWNAQVEKATAASAAAMPTDAQVLGAVNRAARAETTVVCAAGGLPGELHKLWRTQDSDGYHLEYGYSCMGYEIAGGLGVKMARPDREVVVMVGDGSYLMMNSEIATSVMQGHKLIVVLLDNRGFGCIHRLQQGCGGDTYNNLWRDSFAHAQAGIDFVAHARALGAHAEKAQLSNLGAALERARGADRTSVIVVETDPERGSGIGGAWWDVPVAEVSDSPGVATARRNQYEQKRD